MYLLRHSLYDDIDYISKTSNLIESLAEICVENRNKIKAIINYNYDDLFEQSLKARGLSYKSMRYGKKIAKGKDYLPVYHPHGIISIKGGETMTDPNIRRLLTISSSIFQVRHYAFLTITDGKDFIYVNLMT